MTDTSSNTPICGEIRTVGQLRAALDGFADDTPLIVNAEVPQDSEFVDEQVITSVGFGRIDWGDGHGPEQDTVLGLSCRSASWIDIDDIRKRPVRRALVQDERRGDEQS